MNARAQERAVLMTAWPLAGRRVVVFGGGVVAAGRVGLLLDAHADVRVVSPVLGPELSALQDRVQWVARRGQEADLDDAAMAFVAIDDPVASEELGLAARRLRVPVNVADVPELCDFWVPSVHRDGDIQVAVTTTGQAPALAARLRREIAASVPSDAGAAVAAFGRLRRAIRDAAPYVPPAVRMPWLTAYANRWTWEALAELDDERIAAVVSAYLAELGEPIAPEVRPGPEVRPEPAVRAEPEVPPGRVVLVGAGPGDPDMLTLRARQALEEADLVVVDRIVPRAMHALVRGDLRVARKLKGRSAAAQEEIEELVVRAARAGKQVARLKAGDPFVFGRGADEVERFTAEGLSVEVVPGLSSALVAPLLAGIPVTRRGVADRVVVLTGHGRNGSRPRLPAYAPDTTLVWLMAVGRIGEIASGLVQRGWPPGTPAAAVQEAGHPTQRQLRATLTSLPAAMAEAGLRAPAVIVVGEVAATPHALAATEPARELAMSG